MVEGFDFKRINYGLPPEKVRQQMQQMTTRQAARQLLDRQFSLKHVEVTTASTEVIAAQQQLLLLAAMLPDEKSLRPDFPMILAPDSGLVSCYVDCGVVGMSDVGGRRKGQEDSFAFFPAQGIYVVADGMGGHKDGAAASWLAINNIGLQVSLNQPLDQAFYGTDLVLNVAQTRLRVDRGARTTLSALSLVGDHAQAFSVGDSPIYWLHQGKLFLLTRPDNCLVEGLVNTGGGIVAAIKNIGLDSLLSNLLKLKENQPYGCEVINALHDLQEAYIRGHEIALLQQIIRNTIRSFSGLTRSICGQELEQGFVKPTTVEATPGDAFLLCSDGLTLRAEEIRQILMEPLNPVIKVCKLLALAADRLPIDNVTAILVEVR